MLALEDPSDRVEFSAADVVYCYSCRHSVWTMSADRYCGDMNDHHIAVYDPSDHAIMCVLPLNLAVSSLDLPSLNRSPRCDRAHGNVNNVDVVENQPHRCPGCRDYASRCSYVAVWLLSLW